MPSTGIPPSAAALTSRIIGECAAMAPLREMTTGDSAMSFDQLQNLTSDDLRPIRHADMVEAMRQVRASVSTDDLAGYIEWDKQYGSFVQDENDAGSVSVN